MTTHHICPITTCQAVIPGHHALCSGHFKLVPKPLQEAMYHYGKKHRGGPSHQRAIRDAIKKVEEVLKGQVTAIHRQPYAD